MFLPYLCYINRIFDVTPKRHHWQRFSETTLTLIVANVYLTVCWSPNPLTWCLSSVFWLLIDHHTLSVHCVKVKSQGEETNVSSTSHRLQSTSRDGSGWWGFAGSCLHCWMLAPVLPVPLTCSSGTTWPQLKENNLTEVDKYWKHAPECMCVYGGSLGLHNQWCCNGRTLWCDVCRACRL